LTSYIGVRSLCCIDGVVPKGTLVSCELAHDLGEGTPTASGIVQNDVAIANFDRKCVAAEVAARRISHERQVPAGLMRGNPPADRLDDRCGRRELARMPGAVVICERPTGWKELRVNSARVQREPYDRTKHNDRCSDIEGALQDLTRYIRKFVVNYGHFSSISACIIENTENLEDLASHSELVLV
jgi:hypothetical protein